MRQPDGRSAAREIDVAVSCQAEDAQPHVQKRSGLCRGVSRNRHSGARQSREPGIHEPGIHEPGIHEPRPLENGFRVHRYAGPGMTACACGAAPLAPGPPIRPHSPPRNWVDRHLGGTDARRFYRARHDGQGHGGQPAKGGSPAHGLRSSPRRRRAVSREGRGMGQFAPRGGRSLGGYLHLIAGAGGCRGGGARPRRSHRGHEARHRLFRHVDKLGRGRAQDQRRLRGKKPLHA